MNFVEIVIDFYLHITSHVFQACFSCTPYTNYYLLNFVHGIVCDFGLANQVWKFLGFYAKHVCCFENLRIIDWKSYFWENWVQNKCFWKVFHLILMHFIHKILCFEEFLQKNALFFKKLVFPEFRSIEPISQLIEIAIKVLDWLCVSISSRLLLDQSKVFSINWNSYREFFKTYVYHVFFTIQNFSKHFSLSLRLVKESKKIFVIFLQRFCKVFLFQGW